MLPRAVLLWLEFKAESADENGFEELFSLKAAVGRGHGLCNPSTTQAETCVTINQAGRPQHSTHIHKHTCPGANTPPALGCQAQQQSAQSECSLTSLSHSHTHVKHTCSVTSTPPTVFHGTHMIIGSVTTQDMCTDGVHGAAHITPKPLVRAGPGVQQPAGRTDQPDPGR